MESEGPVVKHMHQGIRIVLTQRRLVAGMPCTACCIAAFARTLTRVYTALMLSAVLYGYLRTQCQGALCTRCVPSLYADCGLDSTRVSLWV